jgi:hypothetical protein
MKNLLLLAFTFPFISIVNSQQIVFQDDFSGNKNNWKIKSSGTDLAEITEGKYIVEGTTDNTTNVVIPATLDAKKDFSISISASHLSGLENYAFGLNISDGTKNYSLVISAIGFYKFSGFEGGKNRQFIDWTSHSAIKKGSKAENQITISKEGTTLKLYLNEQLVGNIPNIILSSPLTVSLTSSNKQKVAFDDVTIKNY